MLPMKCTLVIYDMLHILDQRKNRTGTTVPDVVAAKGDQYVHCILKLCCISIIL